MLSSAILVIFPMLVAFGGASDLLTMTIQNRVSILLIAGFSLLAFATGLPAAGWGAHFLALIIFFVPCFLFFAAGWMGGGDVKFISAIALWIGFTPELLTFAVLVTFYGMLLTVGLVVLRSNVVPLGLHLRAQWCEKVLDPKSGIPYGITIALAGLQVYPQTYWFQFIQ